MKTVAIIVFFAWAYRYIGVLTYKIRNASIDEDRPRRGAYFPKTPNLLSFLLWKLIGKRFLSQEWRPEYGTWFFGSDIAITKRVLAAYKEVYLWPYFETQRLYRKYRRKIMYEYWYIFRPDLKKLLEEPLFAQLAEDTASVRGIKLVGIDSSVSGRPDWGFSTNYALFIKIPKKMVRSLLVIDRQSEEQLKKILNITTMSFTQRKRELCVWVRGYAFKEEMREKWRADYLDFLNKIAA